MDFINLKRFKRKIHAVNNIKAMVEHISNINKDHKSGSHSHGGHENMIADFKKRFYILVLSKIQDWNLTKVIK